MISNIQKFVIILLLFVVGFSVGKYKLLSIKYDKLKIEAGILDEKYKSLVKIKGSKVEYVYRDKEKVITVIKYLPPEGSAQVITDVSGNQTVEIQNKGFTVRPQFGLGYNAKIDPFISCRFLYWDRYGIGLGLGYNSGGNLFIDRRIDDLMPFFQNTTLGLYGNPQSIGVRAASFF